MRDPESQNRVSALLARLDGMGYGELKDFARLTVSTVEELSELSTWDFIRFGDKARVYLGIRVTMLPARDKPEMAKMADGRGKTGNDMCSPFVNNPRVHNILGQLARGDATVQRLRQKLETRRVAEGR